MIQLFFSLFLSFAMSADLNAKTFKAVYEVPVNDNALNQAAIFPLTHMKVQQQADLLTLKYSLPTELTGTLQSMTFSGILSNNEAELVSPELNRMTCELNQKSLLTCQVQYYGHLDIDSEKAKLIMARKFKNEALEKRLQVQTKFSTDPIGFIKVKLK